MLLREASLHEVVWEDTTAKATALTHRGRGVVAHDGSPAVGIGVMVPG
jgi:hypothetical protein